MSELITVLRMCFDLLLLDSTLYSSSIYTLKFGFRRKGIISLNSPTHRLKCVDLWPLSNCWMFWLLFWKNMIKIMLKNSEQQVWNIERAKKNTLNNNNNRVNRFCFFFVRFQRTTRQSRYSVCLVSFGLVRFGLVLSLVQPPALAFWRFGVFSSDGKPRAQHQDKCKINNK